MKNKQLTTCNLKLDSGYTLVEILIYTVILSLFLLLTVQLFVAIKTANANSLAFVGLQKNLRQAMAEMTQTVRSADSVTSPAPGETVNFLSLNSSTITYQVDDGVLTKTESGQTWDLTTDEVTVTSLVFGNPVEIGQTDIVKISLELEANYLLKGGERHSDILEIAVSLR
jgi:Tfp pilus assembly protein PilW